MRLATVIVAVLPIAGLSCGGSTAGTAALASEGEGEPAISHRRPFAVETGSIEMAIAGEHRSDEQRARDRYRHPAETLAFFGLSPEATVVEIWPEGGWYTAMLAPVLRDHGRLVVATMDPDDDTFRGRLAREYRELLASAPEVYDQVEQVVLFPGHFDLGDDASADMVLTFRSAHNWIRWGGYEREVFAAFARVLAPGGVLGVVQHRAPEGGDPSEWAERGYVPEDYVIRLAEEAGLELVERSEVNANPNDVKAYPNGVWSLPPTLRGGDVDRARFLAIGESDRMTLRFRKPPGAAGQGTVSSGEGG